MNFKKIKKLIFSRFFEPLFGRFSQINPQRRKLIKYTLIGSGIVIIGKILGPRLLEFFSDSNSLSKSLSKLEYDFGGFRVSDDKNELIISDKNGEDILIIDKK